MTDSDKESDEEGDFEVVYGRTCREKFGKISTRSSLVRLDWIYEACVILMIIRFGFNLY